MSATSTGMKRAPLISQENRPHASRASGSEAGRGTKRGTAAKENAIQKPKKSRSRVLPEQKELLISYMEKRPDVAVGRVTEGEKKHRGGQELSAIWKNLEKKLNKIQGGHVMSHADWRKYWNNLKSYARQVAQLKRVKKDTSTGGGAPPDDDFLSESDSEEVAEAEKPMNDDVLRILKILGEHSALGLPGVSDELWDDPTNNAPDEFIAPPESDYCFVPSETAPDGCCGVGLLGESDVNICSTSPESEPFLKPSTSKKADFSAVPLGSVSRRSYVDATHAAVHRRRIESSSSDVSEGSSSISLTERLSVSDQGKEESLMTPKRSLSLLPGSKGPTKSPVTRCDCKHCVSVTAAVDERLSGFEKLIHEALKVYQNRTVQLHVTEEMHSVPHNHLSDSVESLFNELNSLGGDEENDSGRAVEETGGCGFGKLTDSLPNLSHPRNDVSTTSTVGSLFNEINSLGSDEDNASCHAVEESGGRGVEKVTDTLTFVCHPPNDVTTTPITSCGTMTITDTCLTWCDKSSTFHSVKPKPSSHVSAVALECDNSGSGYGNSPSVNVPQPSFCEMPSQESLQNEALTGTDEDGNVYVIYGLDTVEVEPVCAPTEVLGMKPEDDVDVDILVENLFKRT